MEIKEQALNKSKMWQTKKGKGKSSSYDAPTSTGLDTSYSTQKSVDRIGGVKYE